MKLLSSLCFVIALSFVWAKDEPLQSEVEEKIDTPIRKQVEPPLASSQTAKRKQFRPEFVREIPNRFRPRPEFQSRPIRFQTPREIPDQDPRFIQSELINRPMFIRERPQFDEPEQFQPNIIRHVRPQQIREFQPERNPSPDMFTDPNSFTLPASQFMPIRVHHPPPTPQKSPVKVAAPAANAFFNMPFSAVAMTPFKVTTALEDVNNQQSPVEPLKPTSENFQFSPSMMRQRPNFNQQFGHLRASEDEFSNPEFLEPLPPVRRPTFSQFEHAQGSSFEFHPDEMSFGPPISFHVAPGSLDSLKNDNKNKSKLKDESKDDNLKSTAAISSGIKFRPFGVAPIQFQNGGSIGSDSLRSAASPPFSNSEPGKSPFRPIILRPVKLLSPQGTDITKSAASHEDEFKAFMTISEDDLQPMESTKSQDQESLKGRTVPSSPESEVVIRKPIVRRPLIRVRPRDSDRTISQPLSPVSGVRFLSTEPTQHRLHSRNLRPVSTSFVEYRLQPSYIKSFRRDPKSDLKSNIRANARIYYQPEYYNPEVYDHDDEDKN